MIKRDKNGLLLVKIACPIKESGCSALKPRWVRKHSIKDHKGRCNTCLEIQKTRSRFKEPVELRLVRRKAQGDRRVYVKISCPLKYPVCRAKQPRWVRVDGCRGATYCCIACPNFEGGSMNNSGYRRLGGKLGLEHRFVMEQMLGRKLRKGETVHHINGKRADNREENLELRMSGNHPQGWSLHQMREYMKTVPERLGGLKIELDNSQTS